MSTNNNISLFPSLTTVLTVLFVVLKIVGKISWSWWWVLAPVWITAGFTLVVLFAILLIMILAAASR